MNPKRFREESEATKTRTIETRRAIRGSAFSFQHLNIDQLSMPRIYGENYFGSHQRDIVWNNYRNSGCKCTISADGTVSLHMRNQMRVDISMTNGIRVENKLCRTIIALDSTGNSSALIHPYGKVWQYGYQAQIRANEPSGNTRYARMWWRGVSFTTKLASVVFLIDPDSIRTTSDRFPEFTDDISLSVFRGRDSPQMTTRSPSQKINAAIRSMRSSSFWESDDSTLNWFVKNLRITQMADGFLRIHNYKTKCFMRSSSKNGSVAIITKYVHCTASVEHGDNPGHFFVRRDNQRVYYNGYNFIVRNGNRVATFDETHSLHIS